ncbi:MAG: hypothetical protein GYA33_00420 [Thermogutta sp.]|nr:hypothetical protein [Thermogutta sp.]
MELDRAARPPVGEPCTYCGTPLDAADRFRPACGGRHTAAEPPPAPVAHSFRCTHCGAEIRAEAGKRSYVCPFCDSTYVIEFSPDQTHRQEPEFVIPFAVTRQQALNLSTSGLRKRAGSRGSNPRSSLAAAEVRAEIRFGRFFALLALRAAGAGRWWAQGGAERFAPPCIQLNLCQ